MIIYWLIQVSMRTFPRFSHFFLVRYAENYAWFFSGDLLNFWVFYLLMQDSMRVLLHFSHYSVVYNDFRLTLHTFHKALLCDLSESGQQSLKYFQLRMAWDSFIKLLPSDEYFSCPMCSASPNTIICDGITLGFRTNYRILIPSQQESVETEDQMDGCR